MALNVLLDWFPSAPSSMTVYTLFCLLATCIVILTKKRRTFVKRVNKVPGQPAGITIMGNLPTASVSPEGMGP